MSSGFFICCKVFRVCEMGPYFPSLWLFSLSSLPSDSIRVAANGGIYFSLSLFFFLAELYLCLPASYTKVMHLDFFS